MPLRPNPLNAATGAGRIRLAAVKANVWSAPARVRLIAYCITLTPGDQRKGLLKVSSSRRCSRSCCRSHYR